MLIRIFLNAESSKPFGTRNPFLTGYRHGDTLVTAARLSFHFDGDDALANCEKAYKIGNLRLADRDGKQYLPHIRSLSVGDVVQADGVFYAVADMGFVALDEWPVAPKAGDRALVEAGLAASHLQDADRVESECRDMLTMSGQYVIERVA